ncbi:MAG: hypothetical protein JSS20_00125 [Proteobacteria bacterium]|nr:hypothetical protein [Pseudomonadota bacterium]
MRCPCRKKSETKTYAECCEPYHRGLAVPATAEALMRSRYSAFALKNSSYLLATWHASTRPAMIEFAADEEWVQLRILDAATEGDSATVEFIARSRRGGTTLTLHEASRFRRENGRWLYVNGMLR